MLLLMISLVHAAVYSSYLPQIACEQLQLVKHRTYHLFHYSSRAFPGFDVHYSIVHWSNNDIGAARAAAIIAIIMMVPCLYLVYDAS